VILKESENLVARPKGTGRAANLNWDGLATFLVSLSNEGRARFSCYTAVNLPAGVEGISAVLSAYAAENPTATPSTLLATTGAWAGTSGDLVLARPYLMSCGSRPRRRARRPSACSRLARADPSSELSQRGGSHGFVRHCRAAIEDGHARSFATSAWLSSTSTGPRKKRLQSLAAALSKFSKRPAIAARHQIQKCLGWLFQK
jgi:hypothetical protein